MQWLRKYKLFLYRHFPLLHNLYENEDVYPLTFEDPMLSILKPYALDRFQHVCQQKQGIALLIFWGHTY